jgi:hypothetical protein
MTDLGFGLADKRAVLVILFTMVVTSLYIGHPLPIDTTSAVGLFSSLLLLTGFVYASRVAYRLVLILIYLLIRLLVDLLDAIRGPGTSELSAATGGFLKRFGDAASESFLVAVWIPASGVREWRWTWYPRDIPRGEYYHLDLGVLGMFDRALLVATAVIATLPSMAVPRIWVGLLGVCLLTVAYVVTGRFTFVVKDAFHKAEEDHAELVSAAGNPNVSFPSTMRVEPPRFDR